VGTQKAAGSAPSHRHRITMSRQRRDDPRIIDRLEHARDELIPLDLARQIGPARRGSSPTALDERRCILGHHAVSLAMRGITSHRFTFSRRRLRPPTALRLHTNTLMSRRRSRPVAPLLAQICRRGCRSPRECPYLLPKTRLQKVPTEGNAWVI
jgi:hypothetical protein